MRGLMTEAAVLACGPAVATLPGPRDPKADLCGSDRAEGIWFRCWRCQRECRVIPECPMEPGQSVTAACDECGGLTQITRRKAVFA